jgi:hypothetical protein
MQNIRIIVFSYLVREFLFIISKKSNKNSVARLLDQGNVGLRINGLESAKRLVNKNEFRSPIRFRIIMNRVTEVIIRIKAEKYRRLNNVGENTDNQIPCNSGVIGPYCAKKSRLERKPLLEARAAAYIIPSWCASGFHFD